MELNHLEPALQQFASHLEAIVLKNAAVRDDFKRRIDGRHLSPRQISLMRDFASVTLAQDINDGKLNWWAAFTDYMKKTICILKMDFPDMQQIALMEMIVFTKWTVQSFRNILNITDRPNYLPDYPANGDDLPSIPHLLNYLEQQLIPAMTAELEASLQLPHIRMEEILQEKSAFYIHDGVKGYEIFWDAPEEIRREEALELVL